MTPISLGAGICARCYKAAPQQKVLCDDCKKLADQFNADLRLQYVERRCLYNADAESSCTCIVHREYRGEVER